MGKPDQGSRRRPRRATEAAAGRGRGGRFSARRKPRRCCAAAWRGSRVRVAGANHGGAGVAVA